MKATGHNYVNGICEFCQEQEPGQKPECTHDYKETGSRDSTCEADGEITYQCTLCDSIDTKPIPAKGHNYGNDGKCTNCGAANPDYKPPVDGTTEGAETNT